MRFVSKYATENDAEDEGEDCNIWDEQEDSPSTITFEKNKEPAIQNIETATLNKLVERATSIDEFGKKAKKKFFHFDFLHESSNSFAFSLFYYLISNVTENLCVYWPTV